MAHLFFMLIYIRQSPENIVPVCPTLAKYTPLGSHQRLYPDHHAHKFAQHANNGIFVGTPKYSTGILTLCKSKPPWTQPWMEAFTTLMTHLLMLFSAGSHVAPLFGLRMTLFILCDHPKMCISAQFCTTCGCDYISEFSSCRQCSSIPKRKWKYCGTYFVSMMWIPHSPYLRPFLP